jgi:hypothetical protein
METTSLSPAPSSPLGRMFLLLVSVLGVALCARASVSGSSSASAAADRLSVALTQLARQLYHRQGAARDRHARHGLSYWAGVLSSALWGHSAGSDTAKRRVSDVPPDSGPGPLTSDADAAERGSMLRLPPSQPHASTTTSLGPDASAAAATRRSMDALEAELAQLSPTSMARMSSSAHLTAMDTSAKAAPRGVRSSEGASATMRITPRGSMTVMPGAWSHIVKEQSDVEWLCSILPPLQRSLPWRCLYACRRDGTSLASLLRASNGTSGPALLLVEDGNGSVFGCVTSDSWCVHAAGKRSYGTGECCVFTMRPYKHCWTWERQGARVFQVASNEALSLGGAPHFALWLDAELRYGSSGTCSTFGSPCLASSPEFEIASVELYHFGSDGAAIAHRRDSAASLEESRRALEG